MYLSPDDAKSDVILAAAVLVFGNLARAIVAQLPLYPRQGVVAVVVELAWVPLLTAAMPWWLSRYRGDGLRAFGLDGDRGGMSAGFVFALPIIAAQLAIGTLFGRPPLGLVLGRLGIALRDGSLLGIVATAAFIVLLTLGAVLVFSFLAVRSREGFPRSPDTSLTQLVRTFGIGAAGVALVLGLLRSIGPGVSTIEVLIFVVALVAVVLLADRKLPTNVSVPRATVLTPAIVVIVVHVFATGGIFRGDLLLGLYLGALGGGIAIVMAALVQLRGLAWSIVPLMLAAHWWAGPLSPLAL
jgi:hypothetical protein